AGGMDLYYLYLNGIASAGLSQFYATNNYTNIKNGYGIFSSRYGVEINNVLLTTNSLDTLACGSLTGHLKFLPSILHPYYPACN
ncbi:MAG: hypothetical protein H7X71_03220, partial [Chitinophagales bacterium]|nr:hypothetical protein [Chitinophagales bacterium]